MAYDFPAIVRMTLLVLVTPVNCSMVVYSFFSFTSLFFNCPPRIRTRLILLLIGIRPYRPYRGFIGRRLRNDSAISLMSFAGPLIV